MGQAYRDDLRQSSKRQDIIGGATHIGRFVYIQRTIHHRHVIKPWYGLNHLSASGPDH